MDMYLSFYSYCFPGKHSKVITAACYIVYILIMYICRIWVHQTHPLSVDYVRKTAQILSF